MKVIVPPALRSYTGEVSEVDGNGVTLAEVLADLDVRYPGFRFRIIDEQDGIRRHIKIFVNQQQARDINGPVNATDTVLIVCALSGG